MGNSNDDTPKLVALKQPASKSRLSIVECVQKLFKKVRSRRVRSMLTICVYEDGKYDIDMVIPTSDKDRDDVLEAMAAAEGRIYKI